MKFYEHLVGKDDFVNKAIEGQIDQIFKKTNLDAITKKLQQSDLTPAEQTEQISKVKRANKLLSILVAEQLRQYNYLNKDQIDKILENKKLFKNDKDQTVKTVKYKMKYSSYILDGAKDKKLKNLYEEMKGNANSNNAFVYEALRNKDMKTIKNLFSIAKEAEKREPKHYYVDDLISALDLQIRNQFTYSPNKNKFRELIKKSEKDEAFQYSVILAAEGLGYQDLLKQAKRKNFIHEKNQDFID